MAGRSFCWTTVKLHNDKIRTSDRHWMIVIPPNHTVFLSLDYLIVLIYWGRDWFLTISVAWNYSNTFKGMVPQVPLLCLFYIWFKLTHHLRCVARVYLLMLSGFGFHIFVCCVPAAPVRRNPSSDDDLALGVEGKYCPNLDLSGTISYRASAHALSTANFPTPVFCLLRSLECFITISQHECRAGAHIA